ncbi:MAG: 2-oxoglutarate dehydrogenase complex dihydrolipoyllysine-residue succinyltransferase [Rhodospirillales bacterium]|nr:2-oxoglutarate dehydrogenase complex dihydrolipoyllysine-residue succinyltransferase [Rhodospirillales bacterium]
MTTEIKVPALGESVSEATVAKWMKAVGDIVAVDEPLVELETDKVTVEVPAPVAGVLAEIVSAEGSDVAVGAVLGVIGEAGSAVTAAKGTAASPPPNEAKLAPAAAPPPPAPSPPPVPAAGAEVVALLSPAVRKLIEENRLDPVKIQATGKDGRLTKGDVLAFLSTQGSGPSPAGEGAEKEPAPAPAAADSGGTSATVATSQVTAAHVPVASAAPAEREERVRMTRLRKMVATRLKEAQNTAAMLTTFNEVDMSAANGLRSRYKDSFEKKHGVRLGVMSLFCKACVVALKEFPAVNAAIDGDDIVYKNHYDIAIAVSSPQGLVVPVVRDCENLSMAEIEAKIGDFGRRARDGQLSMEEMQGGTFTITNGGVFGSLMSTPILNPPQSGILGMHKTQARPMVMPDGKIEARPMMYLALSYDHRIIDGREAVSFLVRVKECIEDPQRILLGRSLAARGIRASGCSYSLIVVGCTAQPWSFDLVPPSERELPALVSDFSVYAT